MTVDINDTDDATLQTGNLSVLPVSQHLSLGPAGYSKPVHAQNGNVHYAHPILAHLYGITGNQSLPQFIKHKRVVMRGRPSTLS